MVFFSNSGLQKFLFRSLFLLQSDNIFFNSFGQFPPSIVLWNFSIHLTINKIDWMETIMYVFLFLSVILVTYFSTNLPPRPIVNKIYDFR